MSEMPQEEEESVPISRFVSRNQLKLSLHEVEVEQKVKPKLNSLTTKAA